MNNQLRIVRLGTAALGLVLVFGPSWKVEGTGFYGTNQFLDQGGRSVDATPEFYWDLEVKRLAKDYKPKERAKKAAASEQKTEQEKAAESTEDADVADFEAAAKAGRIVPEDLVKATEQHKRARTLIAIAEPHSVEPLGPQFESEFSDYHRGALAYRQAKWEEAKNVWLDLLAKPAKERHYRTVWATFMIGKAELKLGAYAKAVERFQETRQLAAEGFADSLAMAADSYGWEGRGELKQGHPEKAARLYLTQLALGDESAVHSLKAVIPDREPVDGMLNYGPEAVEREAWSEEKKTEESRKTLIALAAAARDPLLRRLVTVHILATESGVDFYGERQGDNVSNRCARWLSVLKKAQLKEVEDAEYMGWVAYTNGSYADAESWLKLVNRPTPASQWLSAKLLRRAGKLEEATEKMRQAWEGMLASEPARLEEGEFSPYVYVPEGPHWSPSASAAGDLSALYLMRAKFVPAFDALKKGGLWEDAAFVAERILSTEELKAYVDAQPAPAAKPEPEPDPLRYLLGRRLVREDRYEEAALYLPPPNNEILARYVRALKDGANGKLSKTERAKAWFRAAWIARYKGMEIMGTEGAPDGFISGGGFSSPEIAQQRQTGFYRGTQHDKEGRVKEIKVPVVLKPTKQELERLARTQPSPDVRFHYRVIAAALALRAAPLLADDSEPLADVLNTAGGWVKERDEKLADRIFSILEKRCSKTEIGQSAIAARWFTDEKGPWSEELGKADEAEEGAAK